MEFNDLIGKELDFYGVDNEQFKLGDTVFEAIPDNDDGWRSYLGSIEVVNSDGIFFQNPLAKVVIKNTEDDDSTGGVYLEDIADGHIWLVIGTDYSEDWYPCFTFYYQPKNELIK